MTAIEYWNSRYRTGRGAGDGSKGRLLAFKIRTVQRIIDKYKSESIVDIGCGDGTIANGLSINKYVGLDVSRIAIDNAKKKAGRIGRVFSYYDPERYTLEGLNADVALSLDVLIHIDGRKRELHLKHLFGLARKIVVVYAVDGEYPGLELAPHMCFDEFTTHVSFYYPDWHLEETIPNDYPPTGAEPPEGVSYSSFYVFNRNNRDSNDS